MKSLITMAALSLGVWITGCSQQSTEEVGDAINATGEAASSAVNDTTEAATDAAQSAEDTAETTVTAAKVATEDAQQGVEEGMAGLVEKASSALSSVEGGPALLKNITGFFDSAKETLSGITDAESAQVAVARLDELGASLEGMSASVSGLPDEAKSALTDVFAKGTTGLKELAEKANAIPGVKEILQPKLDELMQKFPVLSTQE